MTYSAIDRLKRIAVAASLTVIVALPARAAMTEHETALYEAAKKEGELTWYIAQYDGETADQVGRAFEKKYPGVKANVVRTTAQVAFQRVSAELKAGTIEGDVFSSTDPGHYVFLKQRKALEKYVPENDAKILPPFRNYDKDGYFHVNYAGLVGIAINKNKVSEAEAPKSWKELLDPKWKGRLSSGHPGYSGTVGVWAVTMRKLYGDDFLKRFEKQKPQIGRSINDVATHLASGERDAGVVQMAVVARSIERGNPVALIYPEDGVVLVVGPSAIIKGTQHPNAAKLFMEFLQGVENAEVIRANYREPIRPEVSAVAGMKPMSEVKLVQPSIEEIEKGVPDVKEEWRELFGN